MPMIGLHALGAVRVSRDGLDVPLGGPRQRRLLAVLLINRDSVVSVDRVAEAVFAGAPTEAAGTTLRSYVARLRKVLGPAIVTQAPGYRLDLDGARFDVAAFEELVARASAELHDHRAGPAAEGLRSALGLWNGDPYAEFADEEWAYPEAQRLGELRLSAQELLLDAQLACGRTAEVLPVLEGLRVAHPLREAFRAQLMTAYYRSGRQADALAELRTFRRELAEELGVDPSPALVELESRILTHDPELLADVVDLGPLRGYRLGERLGTGREGTVHAARLPGVDRELVVKMIRREIADDPDFIRIFEATAHRVASVRHPAVLGLHDYWREPGAAHVVMRRARSGTLRDRLRRGDLARADLVALVDRIGGALTAAASAGLVHGRVTADNVLYDAPDTPVLADFWVGGPRPFPEPAQDVRDFAVLLRECFDAAGLGSDEVNGLLDAAADGRTGRPAATSVAELAERILQAGDGGTAPREVHAQPNPYRGLRAFEEADASNYFGRETLVGDLLERLSPVSDRGRLVLLVGASGTGKSSVVRAGLVPRLRAGAVAGSEEWFVAPMFPGGSPFKELGESLRRVTPRAARTSELAAADDAEVVDRALRESIPEGGQLVLVIDQFEELFTLSSETEQRQFLAALTYALTSPDSRLRVVATLRADYYDRPLAVQPFGALVNDATVAIPAMLPAEIEAAVVEPAARVGLDVDRALAAELVSSLATEPAGLPALQFVLHELAERTEGGTLALAEYRALGGIEGAIAARAEALYVSLDDVDRRQVRELFEALVVVGPDGEPTRRRALRSELGESQAVVDRWVGARLLVLDVHPQSRMPTVEVAHEAILGEWPRLREWIEEDGTDLIVRARLREAATTWADLGRDPSALFRGASLEAALDVAGRGAPLPELEGEYLQAGTEAAQRERDAEARLILRQARTNRRLRLQLAIIAVALVGALVGGVLALDQRGEAVQERHVSTARELAAAADANLRDDPERSVLLALAAVDATREHGEPVLPEAREALHRAVSTSRVLSNIPGVGGALDWSANGQWFVTEGTEETGIADIRDARSGASVTRFRADEVDLNDVTFSSDSAFLATAGDAGAVDVWDVATGARVGGVAIAERMPVWGVSMSPDGSLVAAAWPDQGLVRVARTRSKGPVAPGSSTRTGVTTTIRAEEPMDTAFSPDGRRLAISAADDRVHVHSVSTGRRIFSIEVPGPREIEWSPDGGWLAVSGATNEARVFESTAGRFGFATSGHIAEVLDVVWSPDSRRLATASADGTARVHAVTASSSTEMLTLAAQDMGNGVRGVDFSPDGDRLMTSDWAITAVMVWDVSETGAGELGTYLSDSEGESDRRAALTQDGRALYLARRGGTVERVDLDRSRRTAVLTWPRTGVARPEWMRMVLDPSGALLAVMTSALPSPVFDTRTGEVAFTVRPPGGNVDGWWPMGHSWSLDGKHLAVSLANEAGASIVQIYSHTGELVTTIHEERGLLVPSVTFGADPDVIATTRRVPRENPGMMAVSLWDWREGRLIRRIRTKADLAQLDPTGRLVASTRLVEGEVDVWDTRTGRRVSVLTGHTGPVMDLAFSPEGNRIATTSVDGTSRTWVPRTGEPVTVLRPQGARGGGGVQFSADGKRLITTGFDGTVRVWALDLDELIGIARDKLTRGLTTPECRQYLHVDRCPGD